MKKSILRLLSVVMLAVAGAGAAYAAHIPVEAAAVTAGKFLSGNGRSGAMAATELECVQTTPSYYVFSPRDAEGFVIVSADDLLAPVAGYSTDGKFDRDNLPPALEAWLSDYTRVAEAIASGRISYSRSTKGGEAVAPLLKTKWSQEDPYNRLVPMYSDKHAPVGCVATAIAQVMKYYNYPPAGRGVAGESASNPDQTITLGHKYDWDNMKSTYSFDGEGEPDFNDVQAEAVATLMRDVGYAVNMSYGYDASSAASPMIAPALCRFFNYSTEIAFCDRGGYSTQAWTDEIRRNLLAGSPVIYSGTDGRSGHEFVCDGIDADDMLHINWGWNGHGDGYYDMNILSPEFLGTGAGNGAYYRDQDMVVNVRPGNPEADNTAWRAPLAISNIYMGGKADADGKVEDDYFSICYTLHNTTGSPIKWGEYCTGLRIADASGKVIKIDAPEILGSLNPGFYFNKAHSVYLSQLLSDGTLTDGTYTIGIGVVRSEQRDVELPLYAGDLNNITITVRGNDVYLADPSMLVSSDNAVSTKLKCSGLKAGVDNKVYVENSTEVKLKLANFSSVVYNGACSLFMVPEGKNNEEINIWEYYMGGGNVFIYPGVESEFVFRNVYAPSEPGRYRIYLTDAYNALITLEPAVDVEVVGLPTDEILMTSPLNLNSNSYPRNEYVKFNAKSVIHNPFTTFTTTLELCARLKGAADAQEVTLIKKEKVRLYNGNNTIEITDYTEPESLWFEPLGEYEAFITYIDQNGNRVRVNGDANSATFTLTPCDDEYQAVLTGPVVINGGKPVPADNWSYFDVDFEIMTPTGLSIVPDDSYIDIYKSPRGTDWTYSFAIASIKVDKTVLAPGESTKVKVNFLYRTVEGEEDLIGSTLYLRVNYFRTPEGYCSLQLGDYEPSMSFSLVSPGSGLVDICDDANGEVRIYSLQGHVVYEGRYDEANLKPGVYVVCRANGTSTKIVVTE